MVSILAAVGVVLDLWVYIAAGVVALGAVVFGVMNNIKDKKKKEAKAAKLRQSR